MQNILLLIKNASANLGRGLAVAAFSLLLPPFLIRHMDASDYAIWILVLQLTAYIGFLDFGLQTAVGRYIAYAEEQQDTTQKDSIYSTALVGLQIAGVISCFLLVLLVLGIPLFFPQVPALLISKMRWCTLIVGSSVALSLPANAWNGVFVGLQRNEIPAGATGGAKLLGALIIVLAVWLRRSLVVMSLALALVNVLSYAALYVAIRRLRPPLRFNMSHVRVSTARDLIRFCFGLTVMSMSMLLVSGLDLMLVGRFEFSALIPYSVAASFIPIISGSLYALLNAIMPQAARLHAQRAASRLGEVVLNSTRLSVLLLLLTGLPAIVYAAPIIKLWIGYQYLAPGSAFLILLLLANIIRLAGAAYSVVLVAAGQQTLIKISPISEGLSNFASSLILGHFLGAVGVALGTLIGSVVSIAAHLLYSMPRTYPEIHLSRRKYLWFGMIQPILCTSPLIILAVYSSHGGSVFPMMFVLAFSLSVLASVVTLPMPRILATMS